MDLEQIGIPVLTGVVYSLIPKNLLTKDIRRSKKD